MSLELLSVIQIVLFPEYLEIHPCHYALTPSRIVMIYMISMEKVVPYFHYVWLTWYVDVLHIINLIFIAVFQGGNGPIIPMMGAYPHSPLFLPPWGLPPGFPENHPNSVARRNAMQFMYPGSYLPQQVQNALPTQVRPVVQAIESGETPLPCAMLPLSSSGTDA